MTKKITKLFVLSFAVLLYNCSPNTEKNTSTDSKPETATSKEAKAENIPAVCIWDNISVKESAGPEEKHITSLSLGESITYLGKDTLIGKREFTNILLNDGTKGWALKDFIVNNAKAGVALSDISLYDRPNLLTKSDKTFKMMDIVSTLEKKDDWIKIKGRISGAKWISEGWVKSKNISFESVDIASAKFALEAMSIENEAAKTEAIKEILDNDDLFGSKFLSNIEKMLN